MSHRDKLALIVLASLIVSAPNPATAFGGMSTNGEKSPDTERGEEVLITLEIPLHSPLFSGTPVAVVDEDPITLRDLKRRIASIHQKVDPESAPARKNFADLLDRVITTKLIVHEAMNIGLDELPEVAKNIETVSTELLISTLMSQQLDAVEPDPAQVKDFYDKMSREFLLSTVKFSKEENALSFKERVDSGENFDDVAREFAEEGKAEFEPDSANYMKLKDLLPRIAQAVIDMKEGSVSEIFSDSRGYLIFDIRSVRPYEDPALMEEARQKVLEPAKQTAAREYSEYLEKKYSTVDVKLLRKVDFETKKTGFLSLGKEEPADFDELTRDQRVIATVHTDPPFTVTVADLANTVQESFYHGIETANERKKGLNVEKEIVLTNLLFKRTAVAEARSLGLDQTDAYLDTMDEYITSLLFDVFVKKVVAPDVTISEDEVREYFDDHIEEFSSPKMFRLNAIAFAKLPDAESALVKLQKRADFKWVSANAPGRVDAANQKTFDFDGALLTVTALPEDLQHRIEDAEYGDSLIYSDDKGFHHVLVISKVYPSTPQPYENVRSEIAQTIFDQKLKFLINDWSEKLKEAYETRIFIQGLDS